MGWKEWVPTVAVVGLVVGAVIWRSNAPTGTGAASLRTSEDRAPRCQGLAGTLDERVDACAADLGASRLGDAARKTIEEQSTGKKVLALVSGPVPGVVVGLGSAPAVRAALLGQDEAAAARALRDADVRVVVVSRDYTAALDRDPIVLARLANHDFLEWFQLRHVEEDALVYTVRSSPARIPIDTGDALLRGIRQRLVRAATGEPGPVAEQKWKPDSVRLMGAMRLQGNTLVLRHAVVPDGPQPLERALDELAEKLVRDWEREVQITGAGSLAHRLPDIRLEVHVVMERAPIVPRTRFALFDLWEMGVDGVMFRQRLRDPGEDPLDEKFTYWPGSELLVRSIRSTDDFLAKAVAEFGWKDERPWEKDPRTRLDLVRTQHFMESTPGGGPAVRLVRGMPEVPLEAITDAHVQDMLVAGGEWWLANQYADGGFEYKYWPEQNRRSTEYNEVRHILAARDLSDVWRYRNDPRYLEGARKAMDWLGKFQVMGEEPAQGPLPHPPAGSLLFRYPAYGSAGNPNQKLGTVAVALLGWIAWADATKSHAEDDRIRRMAKFVLSMQEPDGRFKPYYVHPGHSYEHERNDIVPGEAMLALGMVAEYFGEPEWVEPYGRFYQYYQPWFRERAARRIPTGRWPEGIYSNNDRLELVQFGPWSVMAAKQVHKVTGDPRAVDFGLEVADWILDSYQWSSDRAPWPDYVGGYYKMPEELPAMQTFCYSEGTAAAYSLATRAGDPRRARYLQGTLEAIRFAEVMQYDDLDSYFVSDPGKVRGGVKYTMSEGKIRIDYVGHALSTLSQWLDARAEDPAISLAIHDPTDLARPAGSWNSVPRLDYALVPRVPPSGEVPGARGDAVNPELERDEVLVGSAAPKPKAVKIDDGD